MSDYTITYDAPSRRERIATACLMALLSVPDWDPGPTEAAKTAIRYADALIAELDDKAKP